MMNTQSSHYDRTKQAVDRNQDRVRKWRERWRLQGGSSFYPARAMSDMRNDDDRRRYMHILFKRVIVLREIKAGRCKPQASISLFFQHSRKAV